MDFKSLSITILEELSDPKVDKTYVSAKIRACIEMNDVDLYMAMDKKNKELQKEIVTVNEKITTLTDELMGMNDRQLQQFEKERADLISHIHAKDAQLTSAHANFTQMNEYIQKLHTEIASLKESHA